MMTCYSKDELESILWSVTLCVVVIMIAYSFTRRKTEAEIAAELAEARADRDVD